MKSEEVDRQGGTISGKVLDTYSYLLTEWNNYHLPKESALEQ